MSHSTGSGHTSSLAAAMGGKGRRHGSIATSLLGTGTADAQQV
jgi:hypothetical protein